MSGFSGWLSVSLLDLDFVCGSSWKQLARWQGMKELPGSSLMLPSRRPADSLHGPPSPALPGGLRPAQGPLCDVGCPIKANASWIPRPNFPPESLSFTALAEGEGCQRIRFHSAHTDCLALCLFLALAKPWVEGAEAARGVCVGFHLSIFHSNREGLIQGMDIDFTKQFLNILK